MRYSNLKYLLFIVAFIFIECKEEKTYNNPTEDYSNEPISISTDKAAYNSNETVTFTINKGVSSNVKVRYRHLNEVIQETALSGKTWQWTVPKDDYKGYLVDIHENINGKDSVYASIGVDVSSDWSKFPRYGFLSKYPAMTENATNNVIESLNRLHINGLQFYDWHYKHHKPLAGTPTNPDEIWKDIMNRPTYLKTVKQYISQAHSHNMKAMFYNLAFGALEDAASDGVLEQWYSFKDKNHNSKDVLELSKPLFWSYIYITDPSNTEWQNYITNKNKDVYRVFDFDGYHIDQLGNRGTLYDYNGNQIYLDATYKPFILSMKSASPTKKLVMNAVTQYGQKYISATDVDFLYSEVWDPYNTFEDLASIIKENDNFSKNTKKTILAAYMNYDLANNQGYFNTPAVLLADAVIFAFGGAHLEMGEHMLGKEYFPNENLQMSTELSYSLIKYYDFLVAYQNLLRDGGAFNSPEITTSNGTMTFCNWAPQYGKIAVVGKEFSDKQILHLINFKNANSLNWRDKDGTQNAPNVFKNFAFGLTTSKTVKKIWFASPDYNNCSSVNIPFVQNSNTVQFNLPYIKYWDMVVVEY